MALRTLHIGVGGRGRWPLRQFPARDDLEIVGLCDIRPEALAEAREATGLGEEVSYTDWHAALDAVECDVVVVITPPQLHYEMCLASIRAGRHVMVEKPFTMDLGEACEVVREADQRGLKLTACQQARFSAGNQKAMELLADGALGQPTNGLMTRYSARPGVHHSGQQRHSYAWERGIHDFDTAWSIFGGHPATVRCREFNPPWSPYSHGAGMYAILEFDGGGVCAIDASFMSRGKDNAFWIDCAAGALSIGSKQVTLTPADGGEPQTIEAAGYRGAEQVVTDGFVAWVHGGDEPPGGMHHNLWVVAMVTAAGLASDEDRVVDIAALLSQGG